MGISIWEGTKAQELIDAIANNQKIDKQQGIANSGKALVVGSDGLVGFGNAGITDLAKITLINCLHHVAWADDKGTEYIEALENALFVNGGDPRLVYELASNTDLSALVLDTEQHVFTLDENFTILIHATTNPLGENPAPGMFVLEGMTSDTLLGARIQSIYTDGSFKVRALFNGSVDVGGAGGESTNSFSAVTSHDFKFVIKNSNKQLTLLIYADGSQELKYISETLQDKQGTYPATYYIGKNHSNVERLWNGMAKLYRIYNAALSDAEIETMLGITI